MISLILLSNPPRCPLVAALALLPKERFHLSLPSQGPFLPGKTIVVLSDLLEQPPPAVPGLPPGCPAIFSGQNQAAAQFASREGLAPLDCGLSLRDTLTLSSVTETSAMVSLQRPVIRLDGLTSEPGDLPLTLTRPWEPFPLLCCAGALLLAGGAAALGEAAIF